MDGNLQHTSINIFADNSPVTMNAEDKASRGSLSSLNDSELKINEDALIAAGLASSYDNLPTPLESHGCNRGLLTNGIGCAPRR